MASKFYAQAQPKTAKEIRDLQLNWLEDPCWDIESTPGFELYYYQLKMFRKACENNAAYREEKRLQEKATALGCTVELVGYIESLQRQIDQLTRKLDGEAS